MSEMFQDLMDIPKDSDIHGVPKVPGQSLEDLAKQTFLQIIRIMKNVRCQYRRDLVNGPWKYEVHFLPNVRRVMFREGRSHITVIV